MSRFEIVENTYIVKFKNIKQRNQIIKYLQSLGYRESSLHSKYEYIYINIDNKFYGICGATSKRKFFGKEVDLEFVLRKIAILRMYMKHKN